MIERHVSLVLLEGKQVQFEEFLREKYFPAMCLQPGFRGVSVLREQHEASRYKLVIRFEDADSATAWRDSVAHRELSPKFKSFHSESGLMVYEVIQTVPELSSPNTHTSVE